MILIGLLIIAVGAFCQSSCYVPIRKMQATGAWESLLDCAGDLRMARASRWLGASAGCCREGHDARWSCAAMRQPVSLWMIMVFYGVLWGVGGLTFGLSMRYLGVALGQSIALGTCAASGHGLGPCAAGNGRFSS